MQEGKGEDLIGQFFDIGSSGGGIQIYETHKNAPSGKYRHRTLDAFLLTKGKEREGFIKPNWCGRVLRLSILCYYKTYIKILIVFFFFRFIFIFVWGSCLHVASACMRYRRRINDISPGAWSCCLIYMYIYKSCATPVAEESSHV